MSKENFYYEVHVFVNTNEGYGRPVKSEKKLTESDVILLAIEQQTITQDEANMVDYVEPLSKEEYEEAFI